MNCAEMSRSGTCDLFAPHMDWCDAHRAGRRTSAKGGRRSREDAEPHCNVNPAKDLRDNVPLKHNGHCRNQRSDGN